MPVILSSQAFLGGDESDEEEEIMEDGAGGHEGPDSGAERAGQLMARERRRNQVLNKSEKQSWTVLGALTAIGKSIAEPMTRRAKKNNKVDALVGAMRAPTSPGKRLSRTSNGPAGSRTGRRPSLVGRNPLREGQDARPEGGGAEQGSLPRSSAGWGKKGESKFWRDVYSQLLSMLENKAVKESRRVQSMNAIYQKHVDAREEALMKLARDPRPAELGGDNFGPGSAESGAAAEPWGRGEKGNDEPAEEAPFASIDFSGGVPAVTSAEVAASREVGAESASAAVRGGGLEADEGGGRGGGPSASQESKAQGSAPNASFRFSAAPPLGQAGAEGSRSSGGHALPGGTSSSTRNLGAPDWDTGVRDADKSSARGWIELDRTESMDATLQAAVDINAERRNTAGNAGPSAAVWTRFMSVETMGGMPGGGVLPSPAGSGSRNVHTALMGGEGRGNLHNLTAKLKSAAQQDRLEAERASVKEETLAYLDSLTSMLGLGIESQELDTAVLRRASLVLLRRRINILMMDPESSPLAYLISALILVLIMVSSVTFCMETLETFDNDGAAHYFWLIETVCIAAFSLEYSLKFFSADSSLAFARVPLNVVDLVSILPYYLELAASSLNISGTRILRVVRLVRVFRILKLGGRFGKIQVVWKAMTDSMDMLGMMLFLVVISVVVFSTLIYFAEKGYYDETLGYWTRKEAPEVVNPFRSIPHSFWWTMVTLMTVGYGDEVPVTLAGKLVACCAMIVSVLILALPISVIGTNFTQQWMHYKESSLDRHAYHRMAEQFTDLQERLTEHSATLHDLYHRIRDVENEMDELIYTIKDKIKIKKRQISEERTYNARKVMIMRRVQSMKRHSTTQANGPFDGGGGPRSALLRQGSMGVNNSAQQWLLRSRNKILEDKVAKEQRKQAEAAARELREMAEIDGLQAKLSLLRERLEEMIFVAEILAGNNFPAAGQNFSHLIDECRRAYKEMDHVADESVALVLEVDGLHARVQEQEADLIHRQAGQGGGLRARRASDMLDPAIDDDVRVEGGVIRRIST